MKENNQTTKESPNLEDETSTHKTNGSGGFAITALVLGIVAIVGSWIPILNNLSAIIALVGAVFGIIALITAKKKNRKKVLAIVGTVLSVLAFALVLATQSFYSDAIDKSLQDGGAAEQSSTTQETTSTNNNADPNSLALGQTYDLNGVSISVDSVEGGLADFDDSHIFKVVVTYTNNSEKETSFNVYDWQLQDNAGIRESSTYYINGENELSSGTLAPDGTLTRNVYFKSDTAAKVIFKDSILSQSADLIWNI